MHRYWCPFTSAVGFVFALSACAIPDISAKANSIETSHHRATAIVRVLDKCPVAEPPAVGVQPAIAPIIAAIGVAIAPVVIDFTVSAVTDYLDRVQKEHTASYMATGAGKIPEPGKNFCLVVARGVIGKPEKAAGQNPPSGNCSAQGEYGSLNDCHLTKVGLAAPPAFYFEAKAKIIVEEEEDPSPGNGNPAPAAGSEAGKKDKKSDDSTVKQDTGSKPPVAHLILSPQLVQFAETAAERGPKEEKNIGMILVLRASLAPENATSETAAKDAYAVFPFDFGKLKPGTEIRPETFPRNTEKPNDIPLPSVDHPLSDLARTAPLQQIPGYLNMYAFVTESAEPNEILALLSKSFAGGGDDLKKALTKTLQDAIKAEAADTGQ